MKVSLLVTLFDILKRKFATFATQTAVNVHDIFFTNVYFSRWDLVRTGQTYRQTDGRTRSVIRPIGTRCCRTISTGWLINVD